MAEWRTYELIGGPLDGDRIEVEDDEGVDLPARWCAYPGGRSCYDPRPGEDGRLYWTRDVP